MVVVRARAGEWMPLGGGEACSLAHWAARVGAGCWIWWIAEPLRLEPDAGHALAEACRGAAARLVYADHDVEDERERPSWPVFKPAWDCPQILEHPYAGPLLAVHSALVRVIDEAPAAGGQWAALLDAASALPPEALVHVPRVVAHLSRKHDVVQARAVVRRAALPRLMSSAANRGEVLDADVERTPWIRYRVPRGGASIVIPTRDRRRLLARCIESLLRDGFGDENEIVVVDNGSRDPGVATLLEQAGRRAALKIVPMPGPFNFPVLCNAGVAAATRRVIVLLNNDTETVDATWLAELTSVAARSGVGAVGPLLLYPDGLVQSAGVLLGVNRTATSALAGYRPDDPTASAWCAARRRVSAVLGACLAVERDKYLGIGGMDERFAVSHNELDLCLRLEAAGFANVFTPFARVVHREGGTRGFDVSAIERQRLEREEALFRALWAQVLESVDPAHHPALARQGDPFALASGTPALRPRAGWRAGVSVRPADIAPNG